MDGVRILKILDVSLFWVGALGFSGYVLISLDDNLIHWFLAMVTISAALKTTIQFRDVLKVRRKKKHVGKMV